MKTLHVIMFCCFSVVCVEASAVLRVSGHVGGGVSIHCSGSWTSDNRSEHCNMYFCRGLCSRENALIQTERKRLAVTRRGRYSMEVNRGDGAFDVTIKRLRRADAGTYHCGVEKTLNVMHQEVNLMVMDASTVQPGSPHLIPTLQGSFPSSTEESTAASTLPATQEKTKQRAANKLSDTTVVIIISLSLALLVCAAIPFIFYGHCQSESEGPTTHEATRDQADYCEENADVASTQAVQ